MDYQYLSATRTMFNPCVIEYSSKSDIFIVGTYELVEKDSELAKKYSDLEARNNRLGTLELFSGESGQLAHVFECQFGGVFDLRLVQLSSLPESIDLVTVAHANGVLALYQMFQNEISLLKYWKTSSDMLTTVQDCSSSDGTILSLICGGATGLMSQIRCQLTTKVNFAYNMSKLFDNTELVEDSITNHQHPIWFVKTYHIKHSEKDDVTDNLIFIGSEDSKWRVFSQRENSQLYKNSDAIAGITSFEFFICPPANEILESKGPSSSITVFVGSYDEYLRIYRLKYCWNTLNNDQPNHNLVCSIEPSPLLLYKVHIEGGGIWRMKMYPFYQQKCDRSLLLISAMYSGVYILSFDKDDVICVDVNQECIKCRTKCENVQLTLPANSSEDNEQAKEQQLIYGVASNGDLSTVLFASFYDKQLYRFRKYTLITT